MKTPTLLMMVFTLLVPLRAQIPPDREGLLSGQGMGLARAAEENGFPGPKHVIELKGELGLTPDQLRKAEALREGVGISARILGQQIVTQESTLVALYQRATAEEPAVQMLLREIGKLRADLRFVHLQAHTRMRQILTPGQVRRYRELRGYEAAKTE